MLCLALSYVIFFFQAEDGIRDLVRSRGLGDVYKRQVLACGQLAREAELVGLYDIHTQAGTRRQGFAITLCAVSYTHLTLPTSDLV